MAKRSAFGNYITCDKDKNGKNGLNNQTNKNT